VKPKPKTGERRQIRQPLKIDALPLETRDEICRLRNAVGRSWMEIEELSRIFVPWDHLGAAVIAKFPGRKLGHTILHRWYDLRVEQKAKEANERSQLVREFISSFAGRGYKDLPAATKNALAEQIYKVYATAGSSGQEHINNLAKLMELLVEDKRADVLESRAATDARRVKILESREQRSRAVFDKTTSDAAAKVGKGKGVTLADINSIRQRVFGLPPVEQKASTGDPA